MMNTALDETEPSTRTSNDQAPWPRLVWRPLTPTQAACCCPAKPAFQAVIPPASTVGTPVEILLCTHHYRESRTELQRIGSAIYDSSGRAIALPN